MRTLIVLLSILAAASSNADDLRHPSSVNKFCIEGDGDALCPIFPNDQIDFSDKFVYMLVNVETQSRFDVFSWQAFVALNWDELDQTATSTETWGNFQRREKLFGNDSALDACADHASGADVITANLTQADGQVLIDQSGNFIVYETRLNLVAEAYIFDNMLQTSQGLNALAEPISFPQGDISGPPTPASVLIKTSWRILGPDTDTGSYIVKEGLIHVSAENATTGEPMCLREKLGLVGMHIVSRTQSGNGDEWLWSTFEHRATAPTASNTREINAIYSRDLFPGGCAAPKAPPLHEYILFDANRPTAVTNESPAGVWTWATSQPYARVNSLPVTTPPQIVRCWEIFEGTRELNQMWHEKLGDTPLAHYNLISTQWRGADKSPLFEHGEVPRFLTNTTMETYIQADKDGTCLGCHAEAKTILGGDANFTFLFREAQ